MSAFCSLARLSGGTGDGDGVGIAAGAAVDVGSGVAADTVLLPGTQAVKNRKIRANVSVGIIVARRLICFIIFL